MYRYKLIIERTRGTIIDDEFFLPDDETTKKIIAEAHVTNDMVQTGETQVIDHLFLKAKDKFKGAQ